MGLALLALVLPHDVLLVLAWPVQQLAGLLIALVQWICHWPAAQVLTGHPQPWVVLLMAFGLIPWVISSHRGLRGFGVVTLFSAVLLHAVVQLGDGVVVASRFGRHWLLARHRGRAALVSTHADPQSCRVAKQLAHSHGHRRLDWIVLLDPVASEAMVLHSRYRPTGGRRSSCKMASSDGVCWPRLRRFGPYGVRLVPDQVDGQEHGWVFVPQEISNVGCVVMRRKTPWGWTSKIVERLFNVMERWQSPVDRARLEIV